MNPIIRRELLELLRTRQAAIAQIGLAIACTLLVLLRWPATGVSDLSGARSAQVLRVFGYGLFAGVLFVVPAFPATSLVRERIKGTLALLLNSPMTPLSIYLGKLGGVLGFTGLLLLVTLPAAAACYALGGSSTQGGVGLLYLILVVATLQITTIALWISLRSISPDSALRTTYGLILALAVLPLVPHWMTQGDTDILADITGVVRCVSPVPAVMEVLGQDSASSHGMGGTGGSIWKYVAIALAMSLLFALATVARLRARPLDRSRDSGIMTQDRSTGDRLKRRLFFLLDPQSRSGSMSLLINPVMTKEFRSRRFGRGHWMIRLIAISAILSLALSYFAAQGALGWGIEIIGGALVLLQTAILILFTPSLTAGTISSERERGTWQLLRITPLSPGKILRGKLLSVAFPLLLLLCATLPGYLFLMTIKPELSQQVQRVVISLAMTALFAVMVSAVSSAFFRATATATAVANLALVGICIGTLLAVIARDAPFGRGTVEAILTVNPVAAALHAAETPGFTDYDLLPLNWWIIGSVSLALLLVLIARTRQLCRPD
jgi:ABC-type transport system involved in multi-copper enzyme maturation permease subunit